MQQSAVRHALAEGLKRFGVGEGSLPVPPSAFDYHLVEKAAEALYTFVFSGCDRLDGKHQWCDCDEGTRAGFRREAIVVLAS